jgi:hypothetical protein
VLFSHETPFQISIACIKLFPQQQHPALASLKNPTKDQSPMSTAAAPLTRPTTSNRSKHIFWYALGLAGLSVLYYTDYPLLTHPNDPFARKLVFDRLFFLPHAFCGIVGTVLGPFQFSTRFRHAISACTA